MLERLPAVDRNLVALRQVMTNPDLWGLPEAHCVTLLNPGSIDEVLDAVHSAATAAEDALLFYFAGHGLLDDKSDLYLALPDSDSSRIYRAVRYDDIRREVVGTARACYGKVVILDCCYSGRALLGGMSGQIEMADHARVDGTYLMTASAETSVALAPPGEDYTAFTGALVDKLLHGLPDGPDLLDMETLFYHVRADLLSRNFPIPQQRTRNDGKAIALARNRRGRGRKGTQEKVKSLVRDLPEPPVGFENMMRRPPLEMDRQIQALRTSEDEVSADQLLAAAAARRADQEVAAMVDLLRAQQRLRELTIVIKAAGRRAPAEVLRIVDALRDTDLPEDATALIASVGAGSPEDVAGMAQLLNEQQKLDDITLLLDAALDTAQQQNSLIALVSSLWLVGLREEVDSLLQRAAGKLPGPAIVSLADELRAAGREQAAFGLYVASAETMAKRSPDTIAQLCASMTSAGQSPYSERIARVAIEAATSPASMLDIASAFWTTAQDNYADQTLTWAATTLPNSDIAVIAAELRARERDAEAYRLCVQATKNRTATAIHEIVTALREAGRPVDAKNLLKETVKQVPVHVLPELLDTSQSADQRPILAAAVGRDPQDVAELRDTLRVGHPQMAKQLVELIVTTRTDQMSTRLPIAIADLDDRSKEQALLATLATYDKDDIAALLWNLSTEDAKLLFFLAVQKGNPTTYSIVSALRSVPHPPEYHDPVHAFITEQPAERFATLLDSLSNAGLTQYVDVVLIKSAGRSQGVHGIAHHIATLQASGQTENAHQLLINALTGRTIPELRDLIGALHKMDQRAALATTVTWVQANNVSIAVANLANMLRQIGLNEYAENIAPNTATTQEEPVKTNRLLWRRRK